MSHPLRFPTVVGSQLARIFCEPISVVCLQAVLAFGLVWSSRIALTLVVYGSVGKATCAAASFLARSSLYQYDLKIFPGKRVSLVAVRFLRVLRAGYSDAAFEVFVGRHCLQMVRINARANAAQMVNNIAGRNRPDKVLVGAAVCACNV